MLIASIDPSVLVLAFIVGYLLLGRTRRGRQSVLGPVLENPLMQTRIAALVGARAEDLPFPTGARHASPEK